VLELVTGIVVAVVALGVVLEPLLRADPRSLTPATPSLDDDFTTIEESESPKIQALLALREIEFDKATGKLSDADYALLKRKYADSAVAAIRNEQQDESGAALEKDEDDAAEAMIASVKSKELAACPTCRNKLESGSIFCSTCGRSLLVEDAPMRCWMCGADVPVGAQFCAECGTRFPEEIPAAADDS
jgi:DNA-directed RNA polymerase subunit RPC12/RpoP